MDYKIDVNITQVARDLLELLRTETDLPMKQCQTTACAIISLLCRDIPQTDEQLRPVATRLIDDNVIDIDNCQDAQRIRNYLSRFAEFKGDEQQRSWSVYEDESIIVDTLNAIDRLITRADFRVSIRVLSDNSYRFIDDLIDFYQMETRLSVKSSIIDLLTTMCRLDERLVSIELQTSLPIYLAIDMHRQLHNIVEWFEKKSLCLLTLLFATGESIPISHYDIFTDEFIDSQLNAIATTIDDQMSDIRMTFILSFNAHFVVNDINNVVIRVLTKCPSNVGGAFVERLLIMINRQNDPVWIFESTTPTYVSSVLKLLMDIMSIDHLGETLFYSNDAKVLIAVLRRELKDLNAGKRRLLVLNIVGKIVHNNADLLHDDDRDDIFSILHSIDAAEDTYPDERMVIQTIVN